VGVAVAAALVLPNVIPAAGEGRMGH